MTTNKNEINWAISDADGTYITQGLPGPSICSQGMQAACEIAADRGEPVWLFPDALDAPSIEVTPDANWRDIEAQAFALLEEWEPEIDDDEDYQPNTDPTLPREVI